MGARGPNGEPEGIARVREEFTSEAREKRSDEYAGALRTRHTVKHMRAPYPPQGIHEQGQPNVCMCIDGVVVIMCADTRCNHKYASVLRIVRLCVHARACACVCFVDG
jgi:hypothetical protein